MTRPLEEMADVFERMQFSNATFWVRPFPILRKQTLNARQDSLSIRAIPGKRFRNEIVEPLELELSFRSLRPRERAGYARALENPKC